MLCRSFEFYKESLAWFLVVISIGSIGLRWKIAMTLAKCTFFKGK
jgi:hypothetical protein